MAPLTLLPGRRGSRPDRHHGRVLRATRECGTDHCRGHDGDGGQLRFRRTRAGNIFRCSSCWLGKKSPMRCMPSAERSSFRSGTVGAPAILTLITVSSRWPRVHCGSKMTKRTLRKTRSPTWFRANCAMMNLRGIVAGFVPRGEECAGLRVSTAWKFMAPMVTCSMSSCATAPTAHRSVRRFDRDPCPLVTRSARRCHWRVATKGASVRALSPLV